MLNRPMPVLCSLLALTLCACSDEPEPPKPPPAAVDEAAPVSDKVVLELELPVPQFVGTPRNIPADNLDPIIGRRRRAAFLVPAGTVLLSAERPVTASDAEPIIGEVEQVTDGDKEAYEGGYVEFGPGTQYVQIDLGEAYLIDVVLVWHYHSQARVYRDVIVQVGTDPDLILDAVTVFNNDHDNSSGLGVGEDYEYVETSEGRLLDLGGVEGRYVRLYSNGSTSSPMNHYTEVEVYGRPVEEEPATYGRTCSGSGISPT